MALTQEQFNQLRASLANKQKDMSEQGVNIEEQKGYFQRLKDNFVKESLDIGKGFERGLELAQQGKPAQGMARQVLGGVGGFARIAFSPITEALSPIITPLVQKATSNEQAQKIIQNVDTWAKQNPDAAANLKNIIDIGSSLIGAKGVTTVAPIAEKSALKTAQTALKATEKLGSSLKGAGEASYGVTITKMKPTINALISYDKQQPTLVQRLFGAKSIGTKPITEAETAARTGLIGTEYQIGVQSARASDNLWNNIIKPKLETSNIKVNVKNFISNIEKEIKSVSELGRRNELMNALNKFKEEYKNVNKIGLEKLQKYKEGWAQRIPEKAYEGKPIGTAYREIQNIAASKARELIYKYGGEDIKQAYIDYTNLKSIIDAGKKAAGQNIRSRGWTVNLWQGIMDKAVTPIVTFAGKILYRTGEGLEFIGQKGAKKVGDIIK